jgi:uncharacterized caspase-like protein
MISTFTHEIQPTDLTLFYFAGHGKQHEDNNYLFPSDYRYDHRDHEGNYAARHAINAQYIIHKTEAQRCRVAIFIFDCCRDFIRYRGLAQQGLLPMSAPSESLIVFSCAPGCATTDHTNNGRYAVFTESLLKYISTPDTDIEDILRNVTRDVRKQTHGYQEPYRTTNLTEKVYLNTNNVPN